MVRIRGCLTALVLTVSVLSACSSSKPSGSVPCAASPSGTVCIKVMKTGNSVGDVLAYLSASESPLDGHTWRLSLDAYSCNPGTAGQAACSVTSSYPGPTRSGPPQLSTSCRTSSGAMTTTPPGCHDTLAEQLATFGDWKGFVTLPHTYTQRTWLCVSEQVETGTTWATATGALATKPVRACSAVG